MKNAVTATLVFLVLWVALQLAYDGSLENLSRHIVWGLGLSLVWAVAMYLTGAFRTSGT